SDAMRRWLFAHGVMPLYTPLGGSWVRAPQRSSAGLVAGLHRTWAYRCRRAALAWRSDPSGTSDGLPRSHPVVPDDERAARAIPGARQIGMQPGVALQALKEQTMVGPVGAARLSAARTGLTGGVGSHVDAQAACQGGLVHEQLLQVRKGPGARVPIG